jgi:hypothetical protein
LRHKRRRVVSIFAPLRGVAIVGMIVSASTIAGVG